MLFQRLVGVALIALFASGGCAGANDQGSPAPTTGELATTSTVAPETGVAIDWESPGSVEVGQGWAIADAEGDGPFFDVWRDGEVAGQLEVGSFPVETLEAVSAVLERGGDEAEALKVHARQYGEIFRADRSEGCGSDYQFDEDPVTTLDTPDGEVVVYGFTGSTAQGLPSERLVQIAGLREEQLVILTATAAEEDGCLPPEGPGFRTEALERFRSVLIDVVEASGLPPAAGQPGS